MEKKRILITGARGCLGSFLDKRLSDNEEYMVSRISRDDFDLSSAKESMKYFSKNKYDIIIHTACSKYKDEERIEDISNNINAYLNIIANSDAYVIVLGSGAEFDKRRDISSMNEIDVFRRMPIDFYGASKNFISRYAFFNHPKTVTMRLFGCFGASELETRFPSVVYKKIKTKGTLELEENYKMDFFYDEDLLRTIEYYIRFLGRFIYLPRDLNLCYKEKYTLEEITLKMSKILVEEIDIIVYNKGKEYTGNTRRIDALDINLLGFEKSLVDFIHKKENDVK